MSKIKQKQCQSLKRRFSRVLMLGLFVSLLLPLADRAHAAAVGASCAADFMTLMKKNAMLEAERRIVTSNTLIRKPDSVLEYTCFDQRVALVANDLGDLFSESTDWSSKTVSIGGGVGDFPLSPRPNVTYSVSMGSTNLDSVLNSTVLSAFKTYLDSSFDHDFLGGAATSTGNSFKSTVASVDSTCSFLDAIHTLSQCDDFAVDAPFSNDFAWFASNDPRARPATCGSTHPITTALMEEASNKNFATTAFDELDPYLNYIEAKVSGTNCEVADPIPTGVIVRYREYGRDLSGNQTTVVSNDYEDKVCPNPSCYYDESADKCKP
jgi:hypothetical protein